MSNGVNMTFKDTTLLFKKGNKLPGSILIRKTPAKIDFDFEAGSNVMFGRGKGSVFNNYISPKATYQPASRLRLSLGTFMMLSSMPQGFLISQEDNGSNRSHMTSSYIYGSGEYMINDRLRLRGTVMYEINPFNQYKNSRENSFSNNDYFYSIGMDYKVSDHFNIGFEYNKIKTDNPFLFYNSFPSNRRSYFGSPFDF